MKDTTRRGFICGCSAAIAAMSAPRFNSLVFGAPGGGYETLVYIFLRGGIDGLNLMPPVGSSDRSHYVGARPNLAVPEAGTNAALPLGGGFGLHPSAAPLHSIYQSGKVAFIHATGLKSEANRSHFDAQAFIELGTPGNKSTHSGWLARALATSGLPGSVVMPALSIGSVSTTSLRGSIETVNMSSPGSFNLEEGPWQWRTAHRAALRKLYSNGSSSNHGSGLQALDAIDVIELNTGGGYTPANGSGPLYDQAGSFGDHLKVVAQMIKLELGLRAATVDFGGWDTHNGQGDDGGGYFAGRVEDLAYGLAAFYTDLDGSGGSNYNNRTTTIVQSEFGRRLEENADRGSDHGYGNVMMVMSGNANGGLHGSFPGLAPGALFDGVDLAVTTDYRRILTEILVRRTANPYISDIFPGGWANEYEGLGPIGVVQGTDIEIVTKESSPTIFLDGFENGSTLEWSSTAG